MALSLAVPTCAAPVDGEAAAARKEDLEFLYQTLERARPDLFANTPEERFLERKAAIETGLEEADDFTFALELQSLTALAGDSHTTLALGGSMSQTVHYYPMSLLHRDGSWYLSAVPAEHRALLGREITAVNGRSMEEIVEAFAAQVERDLSAGEYRRVVVDLRNNGGGSDGVIWPLLRVLRQAMDRGMEGVEPLEPDVTVPQTMADTLAGRDTAVEWFLPALRWARESGAASGTGEAVQWACAAGLMEIDQGHFRPEEGLTRQEGEAAVERLAALAGCTRRTCKPKCSVLSGRMVGNRGKLWDIFAKRPCSRPEGYGKIVPEA